MILGIDPGFDRVGYAFVSLSKEPRVIDLGFITSRKENSFPQRLLEIYDHFIELIERHRPTEASIEKLFFVKNIKTGINVAQARGVLLLALMIHEVKVFEYAPTEIKKAMTGRGNAGKEEVARMVAMRLQIKQIKQDDASDALAIALSHWQLKF